MMPTTSIDFMVKMPGEKFPHEEHPELHHYTNQKGLEGILASNELWATHYKFLNDATEIIHFKDSLETLLAERVLPFVLKKRSRKQIPQRVLGIDKAAALKEAQKIVDIFYKTTFGEFHSKPTPPFASPYIVSFCSHHKDEAYEQENGLLSQWNRYGGNAGFALVFDTKKLVQLLDNETQSYEYNPLAMMDVVYGTSTSVIQDKFKILLDEIEVMLKSYTKIRYMDAAPVYTPFVTACARLKHRGFLEEREVRILASPITREFVDFCMEKFPDEKIENLSLKNAHFRPDTSARCLHLFDFPRKQPLPIKRIIVGPHINQAGLLRHVQQITRGKIPIICSKTPFINNFL